MVISVTGVSGSNKHQSGCHGVLSWHPEDQGRFVSTSYELIITLQELKMMGIHILILISRLSLVVTMFACHLHNSSGMCLHLARTNHLSVNFKKPKNALQGARGALQFFWGVNISFFCENKPPVKFQNSYLLLKFSKNT